MSTAELFALTLDDEFRGSGIKVIIGSPSDSTITYTPGAVETVRISLSAVMREWIEFAQSVEIPAEDDERHAEFLSNLLGDAEAIVSIHNKTLERTGSVVEAIESVIGLKSQMPESEGKTGLRLAYQKLCTSVQSSTASLYDVINACPDAKSRSAVKSIIRINAFISAVGANESEVLLNIWRRIHHTCNSEVAECMRNLLFSGLAELVVRTGTPGTDSEFSLAVCVNGRFGAMLSAIEVFDCEKILAISSFPTLRANIIQNRVPALISAGLSFADIERTIRAEYRESMSQSEIDSILAEVRDFL